MKLSTHFPEKNLLRQLVTFAAILFSIAVNTFSNSFPLNGISIGTLSNTVFAAVQITPANYAFAIWGLIYVGLIAFGIYQLQPTQRQNPSLQESGYLLVVACLAQCVWIYLFLDRLFSLSVIAMLGILFPLIIMYQRLGIGQRQVPRPEKWFVHIPISMYLSWITVATVVNIANALYSLDWNGWGLAPVVWTVIMMIASTMIATITIVQRHDIVYVLVIIWALVAIIIRQINAPIIAVTGVVMAIFLTLLNLDYARFMLRK
jgi:hypothetical protein